MFDVVSDNGQTKLASSCSNHNIKVTYGQAFTDKVLTNFCIVANPITKREYGESLFYLLWLLEMTFHCLAVKGTICKFRNGDFRGENLIGRRFCNMLVNPTTMPKEFNPCISIKNKTFHNGLIIKVNITVGWTTVVAVLHHLIILFSLRIRPTSSQTEEISFALFCCQFGSAIFWHNQFVGKPFTFALR